ncbi:MAG: GGDEF domain-containing protein [Clostridiales bacterium]|nr:GGDEF domain-containing protein [Clostridiales bacterium]
MDVKNEMTDILQITQVLADMQLGFWVIELPNYGSPKMYGNDTMHMLLGVKTNELTPEELYTHWITNIDSQYLNLVTQTVESIRCGKPSEVKYLWQHPEKGWDWVRCRGYLDETYQEGIRFKGCHYNVTNELETQVLDNRHKIVDSKKLKLYSSYIIQNMEELYEIDSVTLNVNTIFYEQNTYHQIAEGSSVFSIIKEHVHPDYIELLSSVFLPESLQELVNEKKVQQLECKIQTISGEYRWVEIKLFPVNIVQNNKLLFCVSDISDKKRAAHLKNEKHEIIDAFYNLYSSIVEINLCTEKAHILKSDTELVDQTYLTVTELYHFVADNLAAKSEYDAVRQFFDMDTLKSIVDKQENYNFDFQLQEERGTLFKQKRIECLCVPSNKDKLYLVFSDVDKSYIMDSILKHFVFDNNDYLYYVDAKNNFFLSFYKNDDSLVLPPESGDDYESVMIDYTEKYVAWEDQNRVLALMKADYMANRLLEEDSYKFETGIIDNNGDYKRKEITIQSYDKEKQILFISRKDITKEYFKQINQKESLAIANKLANTDALTSLCNRYGAFVKIEKRLAEIADDTDALLIIDLDNFKTVNDSLGHIQGDKLLEAVGSILKNNFRKTDVIARLGGDEFIIYMKDIKNKQTVIYAVEKLLHKLQFTYRGKSGNIDISASVGIVMVPKDGISFEDLYEKSDKALYAAKRQGKNRFSFFKPEEL